MNKTKSRKLYPTLKDAINTRIANVKTFPGQQTISYEAAKLLVSR